MRLLPLPGVFQPPSDAWLLAAHLEQERLTGGTKVLDVCTGSGVLAIAAALHGSSSVTAVDISRRAVAAAALNARRNGVRIRTIRGDLFEPVGASRFDLILSNPPYLPGPDRGLPPRGLARAWEGGRTGRKFIDRIAREARAHLTPGGVLLLVYSSVCGERESLETLAAGGLEPVVIARRRGRLGPILRARADWLRRQGLLLEGDEEEILVVRAVAARSAESGSPSRGRRRSTSSPGRPRGPSVPAHEAAW